MAVYSMQQNAATNCGSLHELDRHVCTTGRLRLPMNCRGLERGWMLESRAVQQTANSETRTSAIERGDCALDQSRPCRDSQLGQRSEQSTRLLTATSTLQTITRKTLTHVCKVLSSPILVNLLLWRQCARRAADGQAGRGNSCTPDVNSATEVEGETSVIKGGMLFTRVRIHA